MRQRHTEAATREFVDWFEKRWPGRAFIVEEKDEGGVIIICDDGMMVSFVDYWADRNGIHDSANAIIRANDPAHTEATETIQEEA
jgi:hypothetical protein